MTAQISYAGYGFPPVVIQQAIWLNVRFTLSFRDVEDLLAAARCATRRGRRGTLTLSRSTDPCVQKIGVHVMPARNRRNRICRMRRLLNDPQRLRAGNACQLADAESAGRLDPIVPAGFI